MDRKKNRVTWSLIIDNAPGTGSWNMAFDEYLFRSLSEDDPQTIVRIYSWDRPTISIGVSQQIDQVVDVEACRERGVTIVRRMTGGKLVLHADEVTYSVCSSDISVFTSGLDASYRKISEALMAGLRRMGLDPRLADSTQEEYKRGSLPCFSQPARNEVELAGKKIVGSAQKRQGKCFIQHGSIPLMPHNDLLRAVSFDDARDEAPGSTSLFQALGKTVSFGWAAGKLTEGFREFFRIEFQDKRFDEEDIQEIKRIQNVKYSSLLWTGKRQDRL